MEKLKCILVVDDRPANLSLVTSLLKSQYEIVTANDGEKAIKVASDRHPDLILLDIMMPDMSGFEVCERLKKNEATASIPVIFLTARTNDDDIDKAFSIGGVDYVTKPLRSKELQARIKTHLLLEEQRASLLQMNEELTSLNDNLELQVRQRTKDLQNALVAIEKRNTSLEQFSNITSHNLRGPVASILGLGQILNVEQPADETNHTIFKSMVQKAKQLDAVLKDMSVILEVQDDVSGRYDTVRLEELLDIGKKTLQAEIGKSSAVIDVQIPSGLLLHTVREYLQSILIHLLANAIEYGAAGRTPFIKVGALALEDAVLISIEDNGSGIKAEHLELIFEPYKRMINAGGGRGLGLYLAKRQTEALKGKIDVESRYGSGSVFRIWLPQGNGEKN